jgi:hypothetical protein
MRTRLAGALLATVLVALGLFTQPASANDIDDTFVGADCYSFASGVASFLGLTFADFTVTDPLTFEVTVTCTLKDADGNVVGSPITTTTTGSSGFVVDTNSPLPATQVCTSLSWKEWIVPLVQSKTDSVTLGCRDVVYGV